MSADRIRPLKGEDVLALFDRVCVAHSDDVAVDWRGRSVTFAELDRISRRLAWRLTDAGLGEGQVAALWLEDRVLWVAALLASLRAGCAFAPLDPDWPEARLRAVLDDLEPRALLVDSVSEAGAPALPGETLRLRLDAELAGPCWEGPPSRIDPDGLPLSRRSP